MMERLTPPRSLLVRDGALLRLNVPRWMRRFVPVDPDYWEIVRKKP